MGRDVVIVGGGVIGLCVALAATQRGCRVVVIDRAAEGTEDGCSFGNMGMIVPSHFTPLAAPGMIGVAWKCLGNPRSPFYIAPRADWELARWCWRFFCAATARRAARAMPLLRDLSMASREHFLAWLRGDESGRSLEGMRGAGVGLVQRGLLMLCQTQSAFDHEADLAAQATRLGIEARVLDPRGIAALEPEVRINAIGGVHFPGDCHIDPARFMAFLRAELTASGATLLASREIKQFCGSRARCIEAVETGDGEKIEADEFVICAGAWSPEVGQPLGLRLSLQAGKGYSLTLPSSPHLPRVCAILTEARVAMTPMGTAVRFGGTMELRGMQRKIDRRRVEGIIDAAISYYPDFSRAELERLQPWCGLRPCSPDGLPYIGRLKAFDNVLVATGHGMLGLSLGPVTGEIITDLVVRRAPRFDLELLSPDR